MQTNFISEQYTAITRDLDRLAKLIQRLPHRDARVAAITPRPKAPKASPPPALLSWNKPGAMPWRSPLTATEISTSSPNSPRSRPAELSACCGSPFPDRRGRH